MRSFLAFSAVVMLVLLTGCVHIIPPIDGEQPAPTSDELELATKLRKHIEKIAEREHNIAHYDELETVAQYLEKTLRSYPGNIVKQQVFTVSGQAVRNIYVTIEPSGTNDPDVIVVGAHYDSALGTRGADDNATGAAAVLELARLLADLRGRTKKRIHLVLFVNEEPPYFKTENMGSFHYADLLASRHERVTAMYSLETLGYYSSEPGSQHYLFPLGLTLPDHGDFIAFIGTLRAQPLLDWTVSSFRAHSRGFPALGGAAPGLIPGIDWSDHWSFERYGFPGLMVTDTAVYRYPYYHKAGDTPDKVDVVKMARVVKGMEQVIREYVGVNACCRRRVEPRQVGGG